MASPHARAAPPPNHPAALADAITQLVASPSLRAAMGKSAHQRVLEGFTATHVQKALLLSYDRLGLCRVT